MNAREKETLLALYDMMSLISGGVLTLEQANEKGYRMLEELKNELNPSAPKAKKSSNVSATAASTSNSLSSAAPLASSAAPRRNDTSGGQQPRRGRKRARDTSPCWDFTEFMVKMANRYEVLFPSHDRRRNSNEDDFPVARFIVKMCGAYTERQEIEKRRR